MNELEAAWQKIDEVARANCLACWADRNGLVRPYEHTCHDIIDAAADAMLAVADELFHEYSDYNEHLTTCTRCQIEATTKAMKEK